MKFVLLDIEQTLVQGTTYYHGEDGIGDYTPFLEEAKEYNLEEVAIIIKNVSNKLAAVPIQSLGETLTISEAAKIWGKEVSTLRRTIHGGKFIEGIDFRKSGNTWLITKESMKRVYGEIEK